jgi:hypothetical protein
VLWVFYEDLKEDLEREVARIANFMGVPLDRVPVATQHSTFAFMQAHGRQFDEHLSKTARNVACGLAPDAGLEVLYARGIFYKGRKK